MAGLSGKQAVDAYFEGLEEPFRSLLGDLRATIKAAAPQAGEVISYGVPAFRQDGQLVYYAAFKKHCSLFPGSANVLTELSRELSGFKVSKGTIQFTAENPLPAALVRRIVLLRLAENSQKKLAKAAAGKRA